MKNSTLPVTEFKAKCLRLLDEVAEKGTTLTITKRGKPVARVEPIARGGKSLRGTWSRIVEIRGDVVHFDTSSDWEAER